MNVTFDPAKDQKNVKKHGISLSAAENFAWDTMIAGYDTRYNYGEERIIAYGLLNERLHALIYTIRNGRIRAISLRKANAKERKTYEAHQKAL